MNVSDYDGFGVVRLTGTGMNQCSYMYLFIYFLFTVIFSTKYNWYSPFRSYCIYNIYIYIYIHIDRSIYNHYTSAHVTMFSE